MSNKTAEHNLATTSLTDTVTCIECGAVFPVQETRAWATIRPQVSSRILKAHPQWDDGHYICRHDYSNHRRDHIEDLLKNEAGEITALDQEVIDSIANDETLAVSPDDAEANASFGDRAADKVASFGGSWTFILLFAATLITWMGINVTGLLTRPFDPYPFILLNLVLSSVAAFQAPIIMMSQRRKDAKDRERAENNYQVNLKSELQIRQLHEKLDQQILNQWSKLNELQRIQIELLEERK